MDMKNEYRAMTASYPLELEREVKKALEAGFKLVGGVSVCSHVEERARDGEQRTEWTYAQAVIHSENTEVARESGE